MKTFSLVFLLVLQNTTNVLLMRYLSLSYDESVLLITLSELLKLVLCTCMCRIYEIKLYMRESMKFVIPAFMYTFQSNLLFIAIRRIPAPLFQLLYPPMKTLITALLTIYIFKLEIHNRQLFALFLFIIGSILVNDVNTFTFSLHSDSFIGLTCILVASCTSGISAVYLEHKLKQNLSVWEQNVYLNGWSVLMSLCITKSFSRLQFNVSTCFLIFVNSLGGIIVAAVMKYADNIVKCFALSLSTIICTVLSIYFFGFVISYRFTLGSFITIGALKIYNSKPKEKITHYDEDKV